MQPIANITALPPIASMRAPQVSAPQAGQPSFQDLLRASLDRARAASTPETNATETNTPAIQPHTVSQAAERAAMAFREITHIIN